MRGGWPRSIPGYARSPAVPGELLAALLDPPAGRWPPGIPARVGGADVVRSPASAGLLRPWCVAGGLRPTPWVCPLPAVPGECLAALLVSPAGCEIPARAGGPLRGAQSGPCYPAEALVRSRWPSAYPWVCRRSRRCPMSTWDTRSSVLGCADMGCRSSTPVGLLRFWYVAGSLEYPRSGCGSVGLFKYEIACGFGEVFRFSFCPSL